MPQVPRPGAVSPPQIDGLVRCIRRDGGRLFADTPVVGIEEDGGEVVVTTASGQAVRAKAAVIATNSPVNDWIALHAKQAPYRTYVIAMRVPRGSVADALYWDTLDPYHYVRLQPSRDGGDDWLIVGGEDHKTGPESDFGNRLARLEEWTRIHFPEVRQVEHRWSGQVLEPVDGAPYIGRNDGNAQIFVSTGDSGQGLTTGVAAGMLLKDLVLGRDNPWASAYDPHRVTLRAAAEYVKENAAMVANLPGGGAVVRQGTQKLAAFRDDAGPDRLPVR
jgi:glycine/D-amino acid oxidase-like deaminating enzyme